MYRIGFKTESNVLHTRLERKLVSLSGYGSKLFSWILEQVYGLYYNLGTGVKVLAVLFTWFYINKQYFLNLSMRLCMQIS